MRADIVSGSCKESHRDLIDLAHIDEFCLFFTLEPIVGKLLEPIGLAIHDPVLFRLDALTLLTCVIGVIIAEDARELSTNSLEVLIPVRAIDGIHTL